MRNPQQIQEEVQQRQEVATWDPITLIAEVRESFYSIPEQHRTPLQVPLEETLSRLELGCKAQLGGSFAGFGQVRAAGSRS